MDTKPNPALRRSASVQSNDSASEENYYPAHTLNDFTMERLGRTPPLVSVFRPLYGEHLVFVLGLARLIVVWVHGMAVYHVELLV